jgi:hypothetical protein
VPYSRARSAGYRRREIGYSLVKLVAFAQIACDQAAIGPPKEQRILRFAIKFDFIGDKRECPKLSLLPWCPSVPEALKTDLISGEVRRRK